MKVILLKEVQGMGRAGEIKNVSDGYAQNFLIPNKLASVANERNIENIEKNLKKKKKEKAKTKTRVKKEKKSKKVK